MAKDRRRRTRVTLGQIGPMLRSRHRSAPSREAVSSWPSLTPRNMNTTFCNYSDYRRDIDGLRGIAVLSVVIYHAFPKLLKGGFIGVDLFFVISGFLISDIILREEARGDFSYLNFYARRARRLFPSLFIVLAASLLAGWFSLWPPEYVSLGENVAAGAGFVANIRLFMEAGYFDISSSEKPLLHLWSLGVEEQFYLIWPTILIMAKRRRNLLWLPVLLAIASWIANVLTTRTYPEAAFYLPGSRFWEFMLGFGVCCIQRHDRSMELLGRSVGVKFFSFRIKDAVSFAGLVLLIAGYVKITPRDAFPGVLALLPTLAATLLIAAGRDGLINRTLLGRRWIVYIGLISYPLYLWHWPLLSFEHIIDHGERNRFLIVGLLLLGLMLAHLTWRGVERPVRSLKGRWPPLLMCAGLSAVAATGLLVARQSGFPLRFAGKEHDLEKQQQLTWSLSGWINFCPPEILDSTGSEVACERLPATTPTQHRLLLIGDSHAMALAEALNQVQDEGRVDFAGQLMAKGGCTPFAPKGLKTDSDCQRFYSSVYQYAEKNPGIGLIILAARWAYRFHGTGFGLDTKFQPFRVSKDPVGFKDGPSFANALRETLQTIDSPNRRIIFIHQAPELGFNPKSCFARPFSFKPTHHCTIKRSEVESRQSGYRAAVDEVLSEFPRVLEFDPMDYLCDEQTCHARLDGDYLYTDDNHLSDIGARRLGKYLSRFLQWPK